MIHRLLAPALFVYGVGLLSSCATVSPEKLAPADRAYFERALATPLEFAIPKEQEVEAWGRAQSFLGRFGSTQIQAATDYVLQTYNPSSGDVDYGYYVTKTPAGDEVRIKVECIAGNMFSGKDATNNAHILAYYIKTGDEPNPALIAR